MGLFGWIGNLVDSAIVGTAKAVGKVVQKTVEYTGKAIEGVGWAVEKAGKFLAGLAGGKPPEIGITDDYNSQNAKSVQDYAKLLGEFRKDIDTVITKLEDSCIGGIQQIFADLIQQMRENHPDEEMSRLSFNSNAIREKLKGGTSIYLSKTISLDNSALKSILELKPGDEKTKRAEDFRQKVIAEVKQKIINNIDTLVEENFKNIQDINDKNLKFREDESKAAQQALDNLIAKTKEDESAKDEIIANACYKIFVTDLIKETVERA